MTKQILLSLLNCSWQWGLLGGLTWLITRRFRRANSTSHLLWLLFLLSLPILFALNQFVPALSINGTVPDLTEAQPVHISGLAAQTADLPEIASTESGTQFQGHTVAGSQFFFNWTATNLILCIWAIGTFTMLIRLAFGLSRIRRLRRTATVADDSYQAICKRLAQQLNIIRPITVCFSDRVVSPISFGWLSPSILIPRKLNLEQFELVAAHELAHVQRLDWLINLFSQVVGAIFFFHPIYHFLNRKLVYLRERICDDWVIQLTGARKNYAQCLLDLVRHENRAIPLALALGRPSKLESRIDSILKHNRRLDLKPKPRLLMLAMFLLLTCLPLLSMAQLMPLRTVQLSLFAQTPQESEEAADDVDKKSDEQKKTAEMKDKKVYKEDNSVKVLDPEGFIKSQENRLFSGPQTGEKLPPLKVTGITGEFAGKPLDIIAETGRKPLVLFLQDTNAVGVKGLVGASKLLLTIDAFQKKHSNVNIAEKSDQGFQIGVVFLADNLDTLPEWAHNLIQKEIPNEVLIGISPDGREGPGSYGLNRNVAQTILVAKDGKVLHNFAFTQPMLYTDPHLLGAIAQVMEIEPATLEKWLNEEAMKKYKEDKEAFIAQLEAAKSDSEAVVKLSANTDQEDTMRKNTFSGDQDSTKKEKILPNSESKIQSEDKINGKHTSSAVSKTTNDPTVVSPFGFGPYPKIPDSWPQGFKYWPCENERLELMQRVEIKLTEQGKNVVGSTMSKGLVYPNLEGIVYVRWSESTNGEKYISRITGYPPDAQRLTELVETLEDQNIPFTEADVPNDIKLVNYDEAGIEPYQFLGKDFSPYGLGLYPPLPDKWKNLEIWPCDSLESELKWRVHIKLISQGKDPLRCMTRDGMVFPLYPDTVYIKWKKLEPDGGYAYNMLAKKEPGDRVRAIIKEKVNKVRTNRTNDFSITKDDFPDDLNVLSFEEGGIDPYIFLNLQKPEEVNP